MTFVLAVGPWLFVASMLIAVVLRYAALPKHARTFVNWLPLFFGHLFAQAWFLALGLGLGESLHPVVPLIIVVGAFNLLLALPLALPLGKLLYFIEVHTMPLPDGSYDVIRCLNSALASALIYYLLARWRKAPPRKVLGKLEKPVPRSEGTRNR